MTRISPISVTLGLVLSLVAGAALASKPQLIMFEQWGCEWCEVWNEEIGPILPKTAEGKCTTFSREDIHETESGILDRIKPIVFTPTFVVLEDGKEVGRVVGYAGEEFFWPQLSEHLKKLKRGCELPE